VQFSACDMTFILMLWVRAGAEEGNLPLGSPSVLNKKYEEDNPC